MIQEQKETKQILICQITTPNIITKYKLKIGYKGSIMEKTIANTILLISRRTKLAI